MTDQVGDDQVVVGGKALGVPGILEGRSGDAVHQQQVGLFAGRGAPHVHGTIRAGEGAFLETGLLVAAGPAALGHVHHVAGEAEAEQEQQGEVLHGPIRTTKMLLFDLGSGAQNARKSSSASTTTAAVASST